MGNGYWILGIGYGNWFLDACHWLLNIVFCQFKNCCAKQNHLSRFCDSFILDSIKRSAINIRRSMLDVRCSTFNLFSVPGRRSFMQSSRLASCRVQRKKDSGNNLKPVLSEQRIHDMQAPCDRFRLSGSGLPWRDSFEDAWVTLNRCDRWNRGIHV